MAEIPASDGDARPIQRDPGKVPNVLRTWGTAERISARKLNEPVNALNRIIGGVSIPGSTKDGTRRPMQLYVATETKTSVTMFGEDNTFLKETIKARKIARDGQDDQPEIEYAKIKGVAIDEGQVCVLVAGGTARPTIHPLNDIEQLTVQQANSAMPDDGESFPPTILLGKRYDIIAVLAHWKGFTGTFECQLNIAGVDIAGTTFSNTDFSESNFQGKIFAESVPYDSPEKITIKVVASSAVEEWEAIFWLRTVLFREDQ